MSESSAVVAYLPFPQLSMLCSALEKSTRVHSATSVQDLDNLLTLYPKAVAVVDPQGCKGKDTTLYQVFDTHPKVPVVVYMALSPYAVHASVSLADRGVRRLLLRGFDDSPERIREMVSAAPTDTIIDEFLREIKPVLERLSLTIQRALRNLFYSPMSIPRIDDLAHTAGLPRRTFQQYLERAGVATGGTLLRMSRVLHVYHHLHYREMSIKAIALKLGYPNVRVMAREVNRIMGCTPSVLARRILPEQVVTLLARLVVRPGAGEKHQTVTAGDILSVESPSTSEPWAN